MQHLNNRLTIALILVSCILIRPPGADAQEDKLDRPVPDKKFSNELLKNVLEELSREGAFTFSYNSKVMKKKQLVTLTIPAGTLGQALTDILGDGYSYVMMDNYVIIRRNRDDVPAVKAKIARKNKEAKRKIKEKDGIDEENHGFVKFKKEIKMEKMEWKDSMVKPRKMKVGPMRDTMNITKAKATMRAIIDDIVRENIVSVQEGVTSFALDNGQFIVNGQSMSGSLRMEFAARYIQPNGPGYYYGPIDVRGRGIFLTRSDLY